jgi:hypothetical protein
MSLLDPAEVDRLILDSATQANVLPITSGCDSHCVFCSHKNNPPGVAVAATGRRSLAEITRTIAFLNPGRVITIGESATPIVEGEPLSHPEFAEIVTLVRRVHPDTPLEITTNGRHLTPETVGLLESLGNVSLNVSLNSSSVRGRHVLMGETAGEAHRATAGVELLAHSAVPFSGSLVAMPNLTGWDDMRDTVGFLAAGGAVSVRVIVPAFSALADRSLFPDEASIYGEVREFVAALSAESRCPVLVEPSCASDLVPVVSGVVMDSPAWRAGVRAGDVFEEINGTRPRSRVDAWQRLLPRGEVRARVLRGDRAVDVSWTNRSEGDAGIVVEYDFDPARAGKVRELVAESHGKSLLLNSELGYEVVRSVLRMWGIGEAVAEAVAIKNRTFGGTIKASGLLTVDDYLEGYLAWRSSHPDSPTQVLVPLESFNSVGFDLRHRHYSELQGAIGLPVVLA